MKPTNNHARKALLCLFIGIEKNAWNDAWYDDVCVCAILNDIMITNQDRNCVIRKTFNQVQA